MSVAPTGANHFIYYIIHRGCATAPPLPKFCPALTGFPATLQRRAVPDVPRHVPTVLGWIVAVALRAKYYRYRPKNQSFRGVARFRTCRGTSLQFAVRIMLASVGTCRGMSAITHSLPASKTLGGSKSRLCAKDHASNLEEVRSLVTNEQSNKCLEEEL